MSPVTINITPQVHIDVEAMREQVQAAIAAISQPLTALADTGKRAWRCYIAAADSVSVDVGSRGVQVQLQVDDQVTDVFVTAEHAREMAGALLALAAEAEQQ